MGAALTLRQPERVGRVTTIFRSLERLHPMETAELLALMTDYDREITTAVVREKHRLRNLIRR